MVEGIGQIIKYDGLFKIQQFPGLAKESVHDLLPVRIQRFCASVEGSLPRQVQSEKWQDPGGMGHPVMGMSLTARREHPPGNQGTGELGMSFGEANVNENVREL